MARTTDLFVGTSEPASAVISALEDAFGASVTRLSDEDPYLSLGPVTVYVGSHHQDDDEIKGPDGSWQWLPLRSQYPHRVEVRDLDHDADRQLAVAREVFDALKAAGRWKLVLVDDMQQLLDSYDPGGQGVPASDQR
jgi:hypothetical protein